MGGSRNLLTIAITHQTNMGMGRSKRNDRKRTAHTARYGMGPMDWAKYKKTNKEAAHNLRMKVGNPTARNK